MLAKVEQSKEDFSTLKVGKVTIIPERSRFFYGSRELTLTPLEQRILSFLAQNPGKLVPYKSLVEIIPVGLPRNRNTVDKAANRLIKAFKAFNEDKTVIDIVSKQGLRLREGEKERRARWARSSEDEVITVAGLTWDRYSHCVVPDGEDKFYELTDNQLRILGEMMRSPGTVFNFARIQELRGVPEEDSNENDAKNEISRLKKNLGEEHADLIENVRGVGYAFHSPHGLKKERLVDPKNILENSGLTLNLEERSAEYRGEHLYLTRNNFLLLETLMRHPGQSFSKEELAHLFQKPGKPLIDPVRSVRPAMYRFITALGPASHLVLNTRGNYLTFVGTSGTQAKPLKVSTHSINDLSLGKLKCDLANNTLTLNGAAIPADQFQLAAIRILMETPGRCFSANELSKLLKETYGIAVPSKDVISKLEQMDAPLGKSGLVRVNAKGFRMDPPPSSSKVWEDISSHEIIFRGLKLNPYSRTAEFEDRKMNLSEEDEKILLELINAKGGFRTNEELGSLITMGTNRRLTENYINRTIPNRMRNLQQKLAPRGRLFEANRSQGYRILGANQVSQSKSPISPSSMGHDNISLDPERRTLNYLGREVEIPKEYYKLVKYLIGNTGGFVPYSKLAMVMGSKKTPMSLIDLKNKLAYFKGTLSRSGIHLFDWVDERGIRVGETTKMREHRQQSQRGTLNLMASGVILDRFSQRVNTPDGSCDLNEAQFAMLESLMRANGKALSKHQLFEAIEKTIGKSAEGTDSESIDSFLYRQIYHLKLALGTSRYLVETVPHQGYRFRAPLRPLTQHGDFVFDANSGKLTFRNIAIKTTTVQNRILELILEQPDYSFNATNLKQKMGKDAPPLDEIQTQLEDLEKKMDSTTGSVPAFVEIDSSRTQGEEITYRLR